MTYKRKSRRKTKVVDLKGFEDIIRKVKGAWQKKKTTNVIYVNNIGFVNQVIISEKHQFLIDDGGAQLVGVYNKKVDLQDLVDDLKFVLDGVINGVQQNKLQQQA